MRKIDCLTAEIFITLPPCAGSIETSTAFFSRKNHAAIPVTIAASTTTPGATVIVIPANTDSCPSRGVWTLNIQTQCGCYQTPVYLDCPAPALTPVHTPTETPGSTECCLPDDALTFTVTGLSPPTIEAEGYPDAELLIDDGLAYAVRLGVTAPSTTYQWVDEDGVVLAAGTYGALGTTQYHDIDLICATYALLPPEAP